MTSTRPATHEPAARGTEEGRADDLRVDVQLLCADLARAAEAVRAEDTLAARARLRACRVLVDALLDLGDDIAGTPA